MTDLSERCFTDGQDVISSFNYSEVGTRQCYATTMLHKYCIVERVVQCVVERRGELLVSAWLGVVPPKGKLCRETFLHSNY